MSTTRSLTALIQRQPAAFHKHPLRPRLQERLDNSPALGRVIINQRCKRVLDRAVIKPENINTFIHTYKLPRDPFFELYFCIKKDVLKASHQRREARQKWIANCISQLPREQRQILTALKHLEEKINRLSRSPLFNKTIYPRTKKAAAALANTPPEAWITLCRSYAQALAERYHLPLQSLQEKTAKIPARAILHLPLMPASNPSPAQIQKAYRALARCHHPDQGGQAENFRLLKWARDSLLQDRKQTIAASRHP